MRMIYAVGAVAAAAFVFIYTPTFAWLSYRFSEAESFYAHGYLVPLVSAYLVFRRRAALPALLAPPDPRGLAVLVFCLSLHGLASFLELNFLSVLAIIGTITGFALYQWGAAVVKACSFSLAYLLFMVPLPKVMTLALSFHMKIFAAQIAAAVAATFIPLKLSGSLVYLPNGVLMVGSPCSGLRSLISLAALSLLFAYISDFKRWRMVVFFLLSVPIALFANVLRIILLVAVYYVYGEKAAMGWFHDFSGMLVFLFAFAGLIGLRKVMSMIQPYSVLFSRQAAGGAPAPQTEPAPDAAGTSVQTAAENIRREHCLRVSAAVLAVFAAISFFLRSTAIDHPAESLKPPLPAAVGQWRFLKEVPIPEMFLDILGTRAAVVGQYANAAGNSLQLYFLKGSAKRSSIHEPEYCYLGSTNNEMLERGQWLIGGNGGDAVRVNYFVLKTEQGIEMVSYCYTINGKIFNNYFIQQMALLSARVRRVPVEAMLVRASLRCDGLATDVARELLQGFMGEIIGEIK
ncbi:MAG: EpsI family protein [Candidatus Omnitrophica bacterium]|nr:EpsI family protein [Candidatus Omnitrophota bacterium]